MNSYYQCENGNCVWYKKIRVIDRNILIIPLGQGLFNKIIPTCICGHLCRQIT